MIARLMASLMAVACCVAFVAVVLAAGLHGLRSQSTWRCQHNLLSVSECAELHLPGGHP